MKKFSLALILLLTGVALFRAVAQDVPSERKNFTALTPNTYAFSKISNIPTSYFTGQIKPSIPLYDKQMSVLKFNMSLDFIGGGGIKVDDPGSTVGRGWMLNTGGIIIRNINGIPDDYKNVTVNSGMTGAPDQKYNGMGYTPGLAQISDGDAFNDNVSFYTLGHWDSEHDIFEYSFGGRSGKFFIGKDRQILLTDDSKLKIIPDFTGTLPGGTLRAFTIIDETGVKYYFESSEVSVNTAVDPQNQEGVFYFKNFASSWLLTKIEAPGAQESITFDYYPRESTSDHGASGIFRFSRRTKAYDPGGFYYGFFSGIFSGNYNTQTAKLDVKTITFSDGMKINFNYITQRETLNDAVIRDITIVNDQQEQVKEYAFNYFFYDLGNKYKYLNYNQVVPWRNMVYFPERYTLHLESVYQQSTAGTIIPLASFAYYMDATMNENILFRYNDVDYWGYHNGKYNPNSMLIVTVPAPFSPPANREPDVNFARMGALKQIYYATGGSEEFEYELNDKWNGTANETVGGIRLKKRYLHDAVDSRNDIITEYKYVEPDGRSSGFLGEKPLFQYTLPHYTSGFPGSNPVWDYVDTIATSSPVNPLSSVEGSPVGYRRVEEIQKNGAVTNGKTVYEYTNLAYATIWPAQDYFPYTPVQRPTWALGLPLVTSVYNKAGLVVTRTINEYKITQAYLQNENYRSLYIAQKATYNPLRPVYKFRNYYPLTGRAELVKKRELDYADNDTTQVAEKVTNYEYNSQYHNVRRSSTANSMKDSIINVLRYPFDYSLGTGSFTTDMVAQNMISVPVAQETYLKTGAQTYLTSAQLTAYSNLGNSIIRPSYGYNAALATPLQTTEDFTATALLPSKFNYKQDVEYKSYDAVGRLLTYATRQHDISGAIYDKYNNTIAVSNNAIAAQIAFKSFEPGEGTQGWTYTQANVTNTDSKTGYSYKGQLSSPTLPSGNYKVRLWAKGSGNITINGSNIAVTSQWKFYTINLTGITTVTINSNLSNVDDIAISPVNATLTTYTYKPGWGMTSQADDNGTLNKFVYDEFNRLSYIRDKDDNIRSQNEYSSRIFRNAQLVAPYAQYFCNNSGIPGPVVNYTVPANIYVSLISQADADAKAIMDTLINGQQYANDYANAHNYCTPVYWNDEMSDYFTRQGCPSGYGETLLYTVKIHTYSSLVSKDDANTKAKAALKTDGQAYANINGVCRNAISLSYANEIAGETYHVYLTNRTDAGLSYDFTIGYGQGVLGTIMEGIYDIQIMAPGGSSSTYNFSAGCGYTGSGTSISFGLVNIKSGCATISIY